jgi:uncharacterized protein (DUF362 family)
MRETSRRDFVAACFAGALLPQAPPKSRVVVARDSEKPDPARLLALLDRTVQALENRDSAREAWRNIVRPGETIGLKVNCLAGRGPGASTTPALVEAICERLQQAGVPAKNIIVFDRLNEDLESAGFRIQQRGGGIRVQGNDGWGYEADLMVYGSAGSLVSKALTRVCDAVINLPVLKDHSIAGVTLALKNMFGAIHNPNKYHVTAGNPYVADVFMLPPIRQKVRLSICEGLVAQYEGGPSYMPQWGWPFHGLIASRDPVALDYTGWQIIEKKRAEMGMKSLQELKRAPDYIATAAQRRLGTNDPRMIDRVEV